MLFAPSQMSVQAKLKKMSQGKEGFDPDNVQLPCQCVSVDFSFAGSIPEDKNWQQDVEE